MAYSAQFGLTGFQALGGAQTTGRFLLQCSVDAESHDIRKFHPPGVDGQLLILNGRLSRRITCLVRYVNTAQEIDAAWEMDLAGWGGTVFTVTTPVMEYKRCVLVSATPTTKIQSTGRGTAFRDFSITAESFD